MHSIVYRKDGPIGLAFVLRARYRGSCYGCKNSNRERQFYCQTPVIVTGTLTCSYSGCHVSLEVFHDKDPSDPVVG